RRALLHRLHVAGLRPRRAGSSSGGVPTTRASLRRRTGPRSRHARSRWAACTRLAGAGRAGLYASCGDRTTAAACVHAGAMCTRIDDALTGVVGGVTRMGKMGEDIAVVAGRDGGNYRVHDPRCASERAYSLAPPPGGASRDAPHGTDSALS